MDSKIDENRLPVVSVYSYIEPYQRLLHMCMVVNCHALPTRTVQFIRKIELPYC